MKFIYRALVYSNVWVALAVTALTFITMVNMLQMNIEFILFVFGSTVFTYNYMRLVQVKGYSFTERLSFKNWVFSHRREVWFLTIASGSITASVFLQLYQPQMLWLLILPGLISLLYPLSFKNAFSGFTSLRSVPGLKMFLIALTWSYVTVLVPVALYGRLTTEEILEFFFRAVLVLGLVIPFDIRDSSMDDPHMQTIPQVLGIKGAQQLAMFFLMVYQSWVVVRFLVFDGSLVYTIALLLGFEIGYWLIRFSHRKHSEMYYGFWIEGVPVFCAVLIVLGRFFV